MPTPNETAETIAVWQAEAFGPAPNMARIVARANEELAEALRGVTAGKPAAEIVEECADVAICLCRPAHHLFFASFLTSCDYAAKPFKPTETRLVEALRLMAELLVCFEDVSTGKFHNDLAPIMRARLSAILRMLAVECARLGGSLSDAIDAKMKVNRERVWKRDGTGNGYHVRVKVGAPEKTDTRGAMAAIERTMSRALARMRAQKAVVMPSKNKRTIYISGPMTGRPLDNYPLFDDVAEKLRAEGHVVYTPSEYLDGAPNETFDARAAFGEYAEVIAREVSTLVMLPGWMTSKGACAEYALARCCGLEILSWPTLDPIEDKPAGDRWFAVGRLVLCQDGEDCRWVCECDTEERARLIARLFNAAKGDRAAIAAEISETINEASSALDAA